MTITSRIPGFIAIVLIAVVNGRVTADDSSPFSLPPPRIGFQYAPIPGYGYKIVSVFPFSPAERMGLNYGDVVLAINGCPMNRLGADRPVRARAAATDGWITAYIHDVHTGLLVTRSANLLEPMSPPPPGPNGPAAIPGPAGIAPQPAQEPPAPQAPVAPGQPRLDQPQPEQPQPEQPQKTPAGPPPPAEPAPSVDTQSEPTPQKKREAQTHGQAPAREAEQDEAEPPAEAK